MIATFERAECAISASSGFSPGGKEEGAAEAREGAIEGKKGPPGPGKPNRQRGKPFPRWRSVLEHRQGAQATSEPTSSSSASLTAPAEGGSGFALRPRCRRAFAP